MSDTRYRNEFKVEAVKQITRHGYSVQNVAQWLGVILHSLYLWRKKYGDGVVSSGHIDDQQVEIKRLRAELKRVAEERDILKKATLDSQLINAILFNTK